MRVVRIVLATAILAGSTAAAEAKGVGTNANKPPQVQSSVRASELVPDGSNRSHKNRHKGQNGSACANDTGGKPANCFPTVSPQ